MCEQCLAATQPEVPELAVCNWPAMQAVGTETLKWVLSQLVQARAEERENAAWLVRYHWWGRYWWRRLLSPYRPGHLSRRRYAWIGGRLRRPSQPAPPEPQS